MAKKYEKPGASGVGAQSNDPFKAYDAVNMEFYGDGTLRRRRGVVQISDLGGDIAHINGWTEDIVFLGIRYTIGSPVVTEYGVKYGGFTEATGTFTETGGDSTRVTSGTSDPWGWTSSVPFTRSHVGTGGPDVDDYRTWMLMVSGSEQGSSVNNVFAIEPTGSPTYNATDQGFEARSLSTHGNYAIACGCIIAGNNYKGIRWTNANEPEEWPPERAVAAPPAEVGIPIAIVPWQQSISVIIGRAGMGEIQGDAGTGFNFRATYAEMAAAAPNTVAKCGANIFFMAPGGRIVMVGEGGVVTVSDEIQKDIQGLASLRDLRAWHDSRGNYYCLSDTHSGGENFVYIYSIARRRWEGKWQFFFDGAAGLPTVGEARCEYANVFPSASDTCPFAPTYIGCGPYLCRWLETSDNDTDTLTQGEVWSRPSEDPRPNEYKQIERVTINGGGTWEIYLYYRDNEADAWTNTLIGAVTAPDTVYGDLTIYKNRSIVCVTSDPDATFRSVEISEISRGGS